MVNEPSSDGTTAPMRAFRAWQDSASRLRRALALLTFAADMVVNACDLLEIMGADVAILRQDAKSLRDHLARFQKWSPR
jgi:hypothetical protein